MDCFWSIIVNILDVGGGGGGDDIATLMSTKIHRPEIF